MTDQRRDGLGEERTDEVTVTDGVGADGDVSVASDTHGDGCHGASEPTDAADHDTRDSAGERGRSDTVEHDRSEGRERGVSVETDATVRGGVALVTCRLANETSVPRGVRLVDRLDGPTLPPRRDGVPEHGWDDDTYTTVVDPGETVAVGYACPVGERPLADPPAAVAAVGDPEAVAPDTGVGATVAAARRSLDGWQPPRDAVPTPPHSADGDRTTEAVDSNATTEANTGTAANASEPVATSPDRTTDRSEPAATSTGRPTGRSDRVTTEPFADGVLPAGVAEYLDDAADRVARAEGTGGSVPETTAALRDTHHTPVTLEQAVARDAAALRQLAERAEALATRAAAADVPVDTLRRVA